MLRTETSFVSWYWELFLSKVWISTITSFCTKQSLSISFNLDPRKSCFYSLKAKITGMHRNYILKYSLSWFQCLEWILPFKSLHFLAESFDQECLIPTMRCQAGLWQLQTCEMCELTSASFCCLGWGWTDWMGGDGGTTLASVRSEEGSKLDNCKTPVAKYATWRFILGE